jgi:hypothetical protein
MTKTYRQRSATLAEVLAPMMSKPMSSHQNAQIRSIRQATDYIDVLKAENSRLSLMLLWAIPLAFFVGGITCVVAWRMFN